MTTGLLARLLGAPPQAAQPAWSPGDDRWYSVIGQQSLTGLNITPDAAMLQSAVWSCERVLSEDAGTIPLQLFRRIGKNKERIGYNELPLARKLGLEPNRWQTSAEWRMMMFGHQVLRSNCYSQIVPGESGFVEHLVPLNPDRMEPKSLPSGDVIYEYRHPEGRTVRYLADEIFHVKGLSQDGIRGLAVATVGREAIGLAIAEDQYAARFFSGDSMPRLALKHPGHLSPEAMNNVRESWAEKYGGLSGAHQVAVLEEGLEPTTLGMTNEDSQYIEQHLQHLHQVLSLFRMPPHKIGLLDRATWGNIEHLAIAYVTDALRPYLVLWEQRIQKQLILSSSIFAEFVVEGLLRGDIKSRYEAYLIAKQNGWLNTDEIREKENLNVLPDGQGKTYWRPANMVPADTPVGMIGSNPRQQSAHTPRLRLLAEEMATRLVRKEIDRVTRAAKRYATDPDAWNGWLQKFYTEHGEEVARSLHLPEAAGQGYAQAQVAALRSSGGVAMMETWLDDRPAQLAALALEEGD